MITPLLALLLLPSGPARAASVDAVVVLGSGSAPEGYPNPKLLQRLCRGVEELRAQRVSGLVLSGGVTAGHIAEGEMMALAAQAYDVEASSIVVEARSVNTVENAAFSAALAKARGWKRIDLVTSLAHLPRAELAFQRAGLDVARTAVSEKADIADCAGVIDSPAGLPLDAVIVDLTHDEPLDAFAAAAPADWQLPSWLKDRVSRAAAAYRASGAKLLYFALPGPNNAPDGFTRGAAAGHISLTEKARVAAVALGVPFENVVISSSRRLGEVPGAVEPAGEPWKRVPNARVGVLADGAAREWWLSRLPGAASL